MKCPRCDTAPLDERERDGVTIDVCNQCRGIWLDRGELERLIARATAEQDASERRGDRDHDHHDDYDNHERHGGRGHKRSWFDIFD